MVNHEIFPVSSCRQYGTTWHLSQHFRMVRTGSIFKSKQEKVWWASPLVKITTSCIRGFGPAKHAISVATPSPRSAPSAVGLVPSERQQASKATCKREKNMLRFRFWQTFSFLSLKKRQPWERGHTRRGIVRRGIFVPRVVFFLSSFFSLFLVFFFFGETVRRLFQSKSKLVERLLNLV